MSAHVREPLMTTARVLVGLLAGSAAISLVLAIQILVNRGRVAGGTFPLIEFGPRLQPVLAPQPIGQVASLVGLATAIVWLVWQHRGHANLWARGLPGLRYSPGWAVGWWFVPFASFFMPYKTTRELWWNAGRPAASTEPAEPGGRGLLRLWWAVYLAWQLVGLGAFGPLFSALFSSINTSTTPGQMPTATLTTGSLRQIAVWVAVGYLVGVAAAGFAIWVVWTISAREDALSPAEAAGPLPPRPDLGYLPPR